MEAPPYASGSSWSWSKEADALNQTSTPPGAFAFDEDDNLHTEEPHFTKNNRTEEPNQEQKQKHYPSRTCRICLEVVQPTYETGPEGIVGMLSPAPKIQYISESPESGRLIRPCKCKGSQRYVHEGCLLAWRMTNLDATGHQINYYECPTCKFKYRIERMKWSRWISSIFTQILLTLSILFLTIFILGFIADPIINLYLDPLDTITSLGSSTDYYYEDEDVTWAEAWAEHILKGLTSLGLLGAVKAFLAMSPWQWWNLRSVGVIGRGGARAGTGRNRMENMSWSLVVIGVMTFLYVSRSCKAPISVRY